MRQASPPLGRCHGLVLNILQALPESLPLGLGVPDGNSLMDKDERRGFSKGEGTMPWTILSTIAGLFLPVYYSNCYCLSVISELKQAALIYAIKLLFFHSGINVDLVSITVMLESLSYLSLK